MSTPNFIESHVSQIPAIQFLQQLGFSYFSPEQVSVERLSNLRYGAFAEIKINLPSKPDLRAIAAVFDTVDAELRLHRKRRTALDQQKRGLMQPLLNGSMRIAL